MTSAKLNDAKKLVMKEKKKLKAAGVKKITYSKTLRQKITRLAKIMSAKELSEQIGVSRSLIEKLKKALPVDSANEAPPPLQLFDVTNSFVKEASIKTLPIMKFITSRGLTIEIFE